MFAGALLLGLCACTDSGDQRPGAAPGDTATATGRCAEAGRTLADTEFQNWRRTQIIPTDGDSYFHIYGVEDHFDPCAELSWVVLNGLNGSSRHGETGNSAVAVVVFFTGDKLIADPAPAEFREVLSVERLADDELRLTHTDSGDEAGLSHSANYRIRDGALEGEHPGVASAHLDFSS